MSTSEKSARWRTNRQNAQKSHGRRGGTGPRLHADGKIKFTTTFNIWKVKYDKTKLSVLAIPRTLVLRDILSFSPNYKKKMLNMTKRTQLNEDGFPPTRE